VCWGRGISERFDSASIRILYRRSPSLSDSQVAIKVIPKNKMKTTREIDILAQLRHPNIICLTETIDKVISHHADRQEDKMYLVMELADGGEVFDYLLTYGRLTEHKASTRFLDPRKMVPGHTPCCRLLPFFFSCT
jgi:serine/threonine protein kinase